MTGLFEILRLALRRDVRASRKEAFGYFFENVKGDPKWFEALAQDYFDRNYGRFDVEHTGVGQTVVVPVSRPTRQQSQAMTVTRVATMKEKLRESLVLMDLTLPNGKRLRHCIGADCTRAGGWLAEVGRRVGARNAVDKKMTESDLRNVWERFQN